MSTLPDMPDISLTMFIFTLDSFITRANILSLNPELIVGMDET